MRVATRPQTLLLTVCGSSKGKWWCRPIEISVEVAGPPAGQSITMEASKIIRKTLFFSLSRTTRCECIQSNTRLRTSKSRPRLPDAALLPIQRRPFSAKVSTRAQMTTMSEPETRISTSRTYSASPPAATPRQQVQSYVETVRKIIKGHGLDKTDNLDNLSTGQYIDLERSLFRADDDLAKPNANPESFVQLMRSLRDVVEPIFAARFPNQSLQDILATAVDKQPGESTRATEGLATGRPVRSNVGRVLDRLNIGPSSNAANLRRLTETGRPSASANANAMTDIFGDIGMPTTLMDTWRRVDASSSIPQGPVIRLSTSLGKTVEVAGYTDVTRAFQRMEGIVRRNQVKKDTLSQKFHIRRGQLRKNKRIVRWRARFKEGFVAECARIQRMKKQGW
jgi:small subunit ribosomal protein MRP21